MSIKRILIPLPGAIDHTSEVAMGLSVAKLLGAHVEALHIADPVPASPGMGMIQGNYGARVAAARPIGWAVEEREKALQEKREQFRQACLRHAVPLLTADEAPTGLPAATWREADGEYERVAVQRAAAFDLMVATSAAVVERLKDIAERSLLRTHRPVLLAPQQLRGSLTGTVMIAWKESLQCWHAVSAALPFLERAERVEVISADDEVDERDASHDEVLTYLRCHGIDASARIEPLDGRSVGETLLAAANEADLMVMGAYAHSRLREMLLGGATRHVLQKAVVTPVLMAH
ncbi:universal stress protein [Desertibaculum subflavum]|uniref:universal stress protein n=1 Tax=Desertibaculum subflavum TaxID=2268458 RepID=UPI0013C4AC44